MRREPLPTGHCAGDAGECLQRFPSTGNRGMVVGCEASAPNHCHRVTSCINWVARSIPYWPMVYQLAVKPTTPANTDAGLGGKLGGARGKAREVSVYRNCQKQFPGSGARRERPAIISPHHYSRKFLLVLVLSLVIGRPAHSVRSPATRPPACYLFLFSTSLIELDWA